MPQVGLLPTTETKCVELVTYSKGTVTPRYPSLFHLVHLYVCCDYIKSVWLRESKGSLIDYRAVEKHFYICGVLLYTSRNRVRPKLKVAAAAAATNQVDVMWREIFRTENIFVGCLALLGIAASKYFLLPWSFQMRDAKTYLPISLLNLLRFKVTFKPMILSDS